VLCTGEEEGDGEEGMYDDAEDEEGEGNEKGNNGHVNGAGDDQATFSVVLAVISSFWCSSQCCGFVTFWYGPGSADPYLPLTNGSESDSGSCNFRR
jgi:hypothetical protein